MDGDKRSTKCGGCMEAYLDSATFQCKPPTTAVDNCMAYSSATTCAGCKEGYYLSGNSCTKNSLDKCHSQTSSTLCSVCEDNKLVSDDFKTCTDTDCDIDNCDYCSKGANVKVCAKCSSGYGLSATDGKCETEVTAHCLVHTGKNCMGCAPGYFSKDGACAESSLMDNINIMMSSLVALFTLFF